MKIRIEGTNTAYWYRSGEQYDVSFCTTKDLRRFEIAEGMPRSAGSYYVTKKPPMKLIHRKDAKLIRITHFGKKNKHQGTEAQLQIAAMNILKARNLFAIHIPNEGKRSIVSGKHLKSQGLQKGFPDILIFNRPDMYSGIAIELKTDTSKPSEEQIDCLQKLSECGWYCAICWNLNAVIEVIDMFFPQKTSKNLTST